MLVPAADGCTRVFLNSQDYPPIYVDRDRIPPPPPPPPAAPAAGPGGHHQDSSARIIGKDTDATQEYLTQYLLQRLTIDDEPQQQDGGPSSSTVRHRLVLAKQTGDAWETLETERPKLLQPPPTIHEPHRVSLLEFERASAEIKQISREMRRHSLGPCNVCLLASSSSPPSTARCC